MPWPLLWNSFAWLINQLLSWPLSARTLYKVRPCFQSEPINCKNLRNRVRALRRRNIQNHNRHTFREQDCPKKCGAVRGLPIRSKTHRKIPRAESSPSHPPAAKTADALSPSASHRR